MPAACKRQQDGQKASNHENLLAGLGEGASAEAVGSPRDPAGSENSAVDEQEQPM